MDDPAARPRARWERARSPEDLVREVEAHNRRAVELEARFRAADSVASHACGDAR